MGWANFQQLARPTPGKLPRQAHGGADVQRCKRKPRALEAGGIVWQRLAGHFLEELKGCVEEIVVDMPGYLVLVASGLVIRVVEDHAPQVADEQ